MINTIEAAAEYAHMLAVARTARQLPDTAKRSVFALLQRSLEHLAWTPTGDFADALAEIRAAMGY
jgi:hypothetical protein